MSGSSGSGECPVCGDKNMAVSNDWKPFDTVWGLCPNCGFTYWTDKDQADLDDVNELRNENGLKPLEQKDLDKWKEQIKEV